MPATATGTGYGYLQAGAPVGLHHDARRVGAFVEKPSAEVAQRVVDDGSWTWNSGMFLLPPRLFLDELTRFEPGLAPT